MSYDAEEIFNIENNPLLQTPDLVVKEYEAIAVDLYQREELDRAKETLEKLVRMRPQTVDYWSMLGVVYRRLGKRIGALICLQKAAEIDPSDRNALVNLGETLCEMRRYMEGIEVLRSVFEMGREEGIPPEEQDYYTIRAGAQLEAIQKAARKAQEYLREQEDQPKD